MSMIINTNMSALNTTNQLNKNSSLMNKSLEKLSSGYAINSAADNAAGLAISEKMRGQIRGLDQASDNAQDTISLTQTAEGALSETTDILQRMRELAVQSANDTNTTSDRQEIQDELDQLVSEVDRISSTTEFNTKKLLNGDSGNKVVYGTNTNVSSASATNDNIAAGTYAINVTTAAEQASVTSTAITDAGVTTSASQSVTVNGTTVTFDSVAGNADQTLSNFATAVNNANIGITASADTTNNQVSLTSNAYGASASITVTDGGASSSSRLLGLTSTADVTDTGADVAGTINGTTATGQGKSLTSTSGDSIGLKVTLTDAAASSTGAKGSVEVTKNALTAHIGANADQTMTISISSMSAVDLGVDDLDLTSQSGSESAITTIENAIESVSAERSKLGAYQNRLEHTINNLTTESENLTSAESNIRDTDMASEMANYTKLSVITQAATAMLAQANQNPQQVLSLLK